MPVVGSFIFLAAVALQPANAFRLVGLASTRLATMRRSWQLAMFTEEISRSIRIDRSREACFDAYSQLERIPEWCSMLGQINVVSPTRSEWKPRLPTLLARLLPTIQWTSDQCIQPEECTIEWQSISGIDNSGRAKFDMLGPDECTLTLTIQYTMPDWLKPVVTSRPARAFVRSTLNTTIEQFKAIIEAEGEASSDVVKANARLQALRDQQRREVALASLTAAVSGNDIAVLEATLEEADEAGVGGGEMAKANARLQALREEQRGQVALASLMAAVSGNDIAVLEAALEEADEAGVGGGEMAKANARLQALREEQRREVALASLMAAVSGNDLAVLEAALEEADEAGVGGGEMATANTRLEAMMADDEVRKQREAKEAAVTAGPTGSLQETLPAPASGNRFYKGAISADIVIACSAREACAAYSDIENFPSYVPLLKRVCIVDEGLSEWELQLPKLVVRLVRIVGMGSLVQWEASYTVDAPHRLRWQSLSGFENEGVATFEPLSDGRCRTVVNMTYSVPLLLKPLENSRWVKRLMSSTMRNAMEAFQSALEADSQSDRQISTK